jgi:hypothetical protein
MRHLGLLLGPLRIINEAPSIINEARGIINGASWIINGAPRVINGALGSLMGLKDHKLASRIINGLLES